ncbi:hypothetical protein BD410DRAFT_560308 [Rickenella mellea]|uniref:Protein SQS1 n=1 Tax=Rickenella mellea TaxID=50990 RepID=A0A4Y7QED4_9AGAM|nr:hypothetical protein BD410DRAFT_560308 [Rickenella mellea]
MNTPNVQYSPRGRGSPSGRATPTRQDIQRGRGRGRGFNRFDQNIPLAKLLDMDRPLLKPITFVRAQINPILFQRHEEILEVPDESTQVNDHVPTADRITRVFSGQSAPPTFQSSSDDDINGDSQGPDEAESLPVVDFHSLGDLFESKPVNDQKSPSSGGAARETLLQDRSASAEVNIIPPLNNVLAESVGFYIDVKPSSPGSQPSNSITVNRIDIERPLGSVIPDDGDDDVIVYVAPHPRSRKATPAPPSNEEPAQAPVPLTATFTSTISESNTGATSTTVSTITSVSTFATVSPVPSTSTAAQQPPPTPISPLPQTTVTPKAQLLDSVSLSFDRIAQSTSQNRKLRQFAASPRSRVLTKKGRQGAARKMKSAVMFGSFGAMREEAELRDARTQSRDPRRDEQRRGDSDVDWGDGDDPQTPNAVGDVDQLSNGLGGMDLDPELDPDSAALKRFVLGMARAQHMTIDDLADAEKLKMEDEDDEDASASEGSSHDSELDAVVDSEEREMIAEDGGPVSMATKPSDVDEEMEEEGSDDGVSSDDDDTPKRGFQTRLSKIRQHSDSRKGKGKKSDNVPDADSSDEDDFDRMFTWADKDEDFIHKIQDAVDGHDWKLQGRDRRQKKALFDAVQNGTFAYVEGNSPAARRKDKSIPEHLQEQWDKDRAKKAARKRERERERMEAATDVFSSHRKGKKARKAILRAATYDFDDDFDSDDDNGQPPHGRVVDMPSLVMQIRAFVADIGGKPNIALPPMDKAARKQVHEIAIAFNLKSKSVGKGKGRYTTLIRTSRTGMGIDERKIGRIMKRGGGEGQFGRPYERSGGGGPPPPRHKEGDVVGKAAPKIGHGNIGFKMLASMGWAEGDRIGVTGGLDAPLTAIMKTSKLGLGHTLSKKS